MKPILIAYATTDGHTRRIAEHLHDAFVALGRQVDLVDVASPAQGELAPIYGGVVLAGSVHLGRHQRALGAFARANAAWLNACPGAFLSVSLNAGLAHPACQRESRAGAQKFLAATGFAPGVVLPVAGAVLYTRYGWLARRLVRLLMQRFGGATDTTRDHSYTDWAALDHFAAEFVAATHLAQGH